MTFVYYTAGSYVYDDGIKRRLISSTRLLLLFRVHGYLYSPIRHGPLTETEIEDLMRIASRHDTTMATTLQQSRNRSCALPSRRRELYLGSESRQEDLASGFTMLVEIGLSLIGWDGSDVAPESYRRVSDVVRVQLNCLPYLEALRSLSVHDEILDIAVVGMYCAANYRVSNALKEISDPDLEDYRLHSRYLVETGLYYLKEFFSTEYPSLQTLLRA